MSRRPYPAYRSSGIPWLGDVPAHWEVKRLRFVAPRIDNKIEPAEAEDFPYVGLEHVEPWTGKLLPLDGEMTPTGASNRFLAGSVLFGKLRPYLAKATIAHFDGVCSSELLVLNPEQHTPRFLLYTLLTRGFIETVNGSTFGSKMPRASWDFIGDCRVPVPPVEEQATIAAWLDAQTARIDALVAKQEAFVRTLGEQRAALVTEAVTKGLRGGAAEAAGLDPSPPLRPSGQPWLGDVPAHWEVKRLRFLADVNPSSPVLRRLPADAEVSFVPMDNVGEGGGLRLDTTRLVDEVGSGYTEFQDGDVLVAKITPCFENGKGAFASGLCNGAAYGTTELHVIRPEPDLNPHFLFHLTVSSLFRSTGEAEMYGAGGQKRVPPEFVKDFPVPVPPVEEQAAIAAWLDAQTARIDALVATTEAALARLREYRAALVTAAVTGQIDVREGVASSVSPA